MTLPPGLQALRDTGVAWCTEKQFAALLDLIETMAGALDGLQKATTYARRCIVSEASGGKGMKEIAPDFATIDIAQGCARAALDKYREFK